MRRFRFALPEKKMVIGLPIGSHITIAAKDTEGKDVMRPYTPVTDDNSKGYVDFVIKASCSTSWLSQAPSANFDLNTPMFTSTGQGELQASGYAQLPLPRRLRRPGQQKLRR